MSSPDSPQKGIRHRVVEARHEGDSNKAREILDDPEVDLLNAGVRAALERLLVPIIGDCFSSPVDPVFKNTRIKRRRRNVEPSRQLPPVDRSFISPNRFWDGTARSPVGLAGSGAAWRSGKRGK